MPHKDAAAQLATRRSALVRRLGAANTLTFSGRQIIADSTDGAGLIADLREAMSFEPQGRRCGVIGAGGAARAVVVALAEAGASEVLIVNRTPARAYQAATLAPGRGRVALPEDLDAAELIVNATPVGMASDPGGNGHTGHEIFVDSSRFGSGQVVVDLVYDPPLTEWLAQASANYQAARQVELWSGGRAPLPEMWRAVGGRMTSRP
jgi:shikimate dehydrogenase